MPSTKSSPIILCAGIGVIDEVFRVEQTPQPDTKVNAYEFRSIGGGNATNAAVAIARLGGRARFAGPLGVDPVGDRIVAGLEADGIDCSGCVRIAGAASCLSAIIVDQTGQRTIVTFRDAKLDSVRPRDSEQLVADVDGVLIDNRYPDFVEPICAAARKRGIPIVLDVDKATTLPDPLLTLSTHVIFSSHALLDTAGMTDVAAALMHMGKHTPSFLAVTQGANDVMVRTEAGVQRLPVYPVEAVDTLGAGDVFHGAFALRFLEGAGLDEALRFAAAAAAVKVQAFGGSAAIPRRPEVERFLAKPVT